MGDFKRRDAVKSKTLLDFEHRKMSKPERGMMCYKNQSNPKRRQKAASKLNAKRKDLQLQEEDILDALQRDSYQPLNGWIRRLTTMQGSTPGALDDLHGGNFDSVFDYAGEGSGDGVDSGDGVQMQSVGGSRPCACPQIETPAQLSASVVITVQHLGESKFAL